MSERTVESLVRDDGSDLHEFVLPYGPGFLFVRGWGTSRLHVVESTSDVEARTVAILGSVCWTLVPPVVATCGTQMRNVPDIVMAEPERLWATSRNICPVCRYIVGGWI